MNRRDSSWIALEDAILFGASAIVLFSIAYFNGGWATWFIGGFLAGIAGFRLYHWFKWKDGN